MPIASLVEDDTTTLKVMSLEYTEEKGSTVVHLFTRDSDGLERHLEIVGHNPSFYVQAASDGRKRRLRNDNRVVKVKDGYEGIDGEELLRVEVGVPDDVPELRENFDKTWEADVFYTDRFAIDNEIKQFISVPIQSGTESSTSESDQSDEEVPTQDGRTRIQSESESCTSEPDSSGEVVISRRIEEGAVYGDTRLHVDEITSVEKEDVDWDILPRTCILDIEVERTEDGSIQSGYRPDYEITGVTAYDSYTEEYRMWVTECDEWDETFIDKYSEGNETLPLEPTGESGENTVAGDSIEGFSGDSSTEIVVCKSDKELLYRLNTWIGEHQPDLISGWNSEGYDIPYIIGRCNKLNEKSYVEWCRLNTLSDNAYVTRNNTAIIDGVEQFDMLDGYKRLQLHDLKSNRLEDVSKAVLDDEKLTKLGDINEYQAWKEDPENFIEYSYRDVRAVVEIDNETEIIETFDHLRSVSGAKYTECNHAFGIVDMVMLRRAYEQDLVLPTSEKPDEDFFHGGHVFEYKAGKHRNVVYPDLACFTPNHKALTPDGIRKIEDLEVGDKIYTLDEKTHEVVVDEVQETHEYKHNGVIHKNTGKNIQYEITPNHNIYTHDRGDITPENFSKKWVTDSDKKRQVLPKHQGMKNGVKQEQIDITEDVENIYAVIYYDGDGRTVRHKLPDEVKEVYEKCVGKDEDVKSTRTQGRSKKYLIPIEVYRKYKEELDDIGYRTEFKRTKSSHIRKSVYNTDNLLEICAWFITEGSVTEHNPSRVSLANTDKEILNNLSQTISDMGMKPTVSDKSVYFNNGILREWLVQKCGNNSFNKQIPEFVFNLPQEDREKFLEVLIEGDGTRKTDTNATYYTSSEQLKDDISRLALSVGLKPSVYERDRKENEYDIHINDKNGSIIRENNEEKIDYNGKVYCVTAKENSVIYAGKDGYMNWIGQSEYPNTIRMLNISPETYIGTIEELKFSPYDEDDCLWGYVDNRPVKRVESGSDYDKYKDGEYKAIQRENTDGGYTTVWVDEPQREKVYYLKPEIKQGFVSSVVDNLLEMKYEYKGTDKYTAIKVIANAVWGVFGDSNTFGKGFRLFQRELAETITLAGREILQSGADEIVNYIQDEGYENARLVGGDTDAFITSIPSASTRDSAVRVSKNACEYMNNKYYPKWGKERFNIPPEENLMEIELESYAASMFVPKDTDSDDPEKGTKKTYAQWITWDEGEETDEIEYKGLEVVRSDTANITQDVQEYVIERILKEDTSTAKSDESDDSSALSQSGETRYAKEQSYEYIRKTVQEIRDGQIPMSEIAKTGGISKSLDEYGTQNRRPTTKIRGAKYADKHIDGENLWDGGKPMTVYVDDVEGDLPRRYSAETPEDGDLVDAVSVEEPSNIPDNVVVDYEKHVQKTISEPLERIFKAMGWSLDEAINNYRQKNLKDFHKT